MNETNDVDSDDESDVKCFDNADYVQINVFG